MKRKYSITIKGNNTFEHTDEYSTDKFTLAVAYSHALLEAFQRNSIEQLRITEIKEI